MYAFQAGEEVILLDGFDSGNNFIAEIVPCFPTVTIKSSKPEFVAEYFKKTQFDGYIKPNMKENIFFHLF